jgi:mannose-1-phosphate guanylyltransferase
MIVVIIAGGAGTRLWPLSTPNYPKHLLKVNNDKYSLLQRTYLRARKLSTEIYVVTEISHIKPVKAQLPKLPKSHFIVEPARRGTANCIVLALQYIAKRHDVDEPIIFLSSDPYIRSIDEFVDSFKIAAGFLAANTALY